MTKKESLSLDHRDLLLSCFSRLDVYLSEYSFANLYLFRQVHEYELIFDQELFIKGKTRDSKTYLMPTKPLDQIESEYLKKMTDTVDFLFPIPKEWIPAHANFSSNENDSDYLFSREKLSTYAGRHLAGRRNLVKQFKAAHQLEIYPFERKYAETAKALVMRWKEMAQKEGVTDEAACLEAIDKMEALGLSGRVYFNGTEMLGIMIGEPLNQTDLYVIHFAKAATLDTGIYQFMYQEFVQHLPESFNFVNLEQDLGDEGLRHAKRAYHPDLLIEKFRCNL